MADSKGLNRKYKDRLFTFIFGNSENKDWTLSLYNAVNGSAYTNPDDIDMKNDVLFLIYAGMLYSKYIEGNNGYHRFSEQQQKAPTPKCVCFYNGTDKKQDRMILSLADSFKKDSEPDIEVKVTMININYGHNKDLLNGCKLLDEYALFIDKIHNSKTNVFEEAIDMALSEMPDDFIIKSFLIANRAEVKRMCITEYDESRTLAEQREEGRTEGILTTLVQKGIITIADAANTADMTVSEFELKTGLKI
ncbi:MAG: hypothetical protein NC040_05335 [Muribaculaceae bacterium]|nr:hypothetical protein [Alistipes senegalensis]MCM1473458.1 hypothetical protein [Muribaculaceae bacterium]